jgi:hypothetical protein
VKGWDSFLTLTDVKGSNPRRPKITEKERIFTQSSITYSIEEEGDADSMRW